jgi:hypothetical protein
VRLLVKVNGALSSPLDFSYRRTIGAPRAQWRSLFLLRGYQS